MTGYGRGEFQNADLRISVEMKSVNHRYLDMSVRLPRRLNYCEGHMRSLIKDRISRGKIDIFVTYEDLKGTDTSLSYNSSIAASYMKYFSDIHEELGLDMDVKGVSRLASLPGVFNLEDDSSDDESTWLYLKQALEQALDGFCELRSREGEALRSDLLEKLEQMRVHVDAVESRCPEILTLYRERLYARVKELLDGAGIDESRILTEVALFADKVAVDEEIVRLRSHIDSMEKELKRGGAVGRKLDFIAQEMNREANTTLSKANDLTLSDTAIELKTLIEKIREQIQNLE